MKKLFAAACLLSVLALASNAQTPLPQSSPTPVPTAQPATSQPATAQPAKSAYEPLVERVKGGDFGVDFRELRMAFTETKAYSPYGGGLPARRAASAALNARNYEEAVKQAELVLAANFVDLNGHFVAFVANRELGRADRADFHRKVFDGLIKSVMSPGDGKSTASAFVVISTDEEYVVLSYLGLRPAGQSLLNEKGHSYDAMRAVNPKTNETVTYYFNIDKPFNWLGNSLKK